MNPASRQVSDRWTHLDGAGHHGADEVHEAEVTVTVSDEGPSGQRDAGFLTTTHNMSHRDTGTETHRCPGVAHLQWVEPVPPAGRLFDVEQLQDSDEHVGVVVRQRARHQAVGVVQVDVEAAAETT